MQKDTILKELKNFVAIESISSDSQKKEEMNKAVAYLVKKLESLGFSVTLDGDPSLIIARKDVSSKHTIGIYGHYDVQAPDPIEEWISTLFDLAQRNGKLFGRGVADNKGHIIQNIAAIEMLIQSGKLTNNIVFVLEGEEETGSSQLEKQLTDREEMLSDIEVFYITDCGMFAKNVPQIEYALRGLVYFELEIVTGKRDLHSGVYGNTAHNSANILSHILSLLKDLDSGKILVPGFYDEVKTTDIKELNLLKKIEMSDRDIKEEMQSYAITTVEGLPSYLASKVQPSMDIHGIVTGFTREGPKTVIPRTAKAKFSFRLVENQNPETIEEQVRTYIAAQIPKGVQFDLKTLSKDYPFYTSFDDEHILKTAEIMSAHFGNSTVFSRSGGSIPVAEMIQRILDKPVILTGFTLPDDNIHAPQENFDEEMFWEGISCLEKIYCK